MDEMKKPNLNRMWETFIKIGLSEDFRQAKHLEIIRTKIHSMISSLEKKELIDWYSFLIHGRSQGVPTTEDDDNAYFHIRVSLKGNISSDNFLKVLPDYCIMARKINPQSVSLISGIDKSKLKNQDIEEAWRIIGEQSEWLINALDIYDESVSGIVLVPEVYQFLHFYDNLVQSQMDVHWFMQGFKQSAEGFNAQRFATENIENPTDQQIWDHIEERFIQLKKGS